MRCRFSSWRIGEVPVAGMLLPFCSIIIHQLAEMAGASQHWIFQQAHRKNMEECSRLMSCTLPAVNWRRLSSVTSGVNWQGKGK